MSKEPTLKRDERDNYLAHFASELEQVSNEKEKEKLQKYFTTLVNYIYLSDEDSSYKVFQKKRARKVIYQILLGFFLGICFSFVLGWFISQHERQAFSFQYVPNAIAKRKPVYVQVLRNAEQVEAVKKSPIIMDANLATIGAIVTKGMEGLILVPKEETIPPTYQLKNVGVQKDRAVRVQGYLFIPDAIYWSTITTQILDTNDVVERARRIKNLASRDLLEVGAAVSCPQPHYCHVTGKQVLDRLYTVQRLSDPLAPKK